MPNSNKSTGTYLDETIIKMRQENDGNQHLGNTDNSTG